jgi:3-hydroxyisobutyrate dehydrogenase-like beta-hydroxyacid dehydrogenase
MGFARKCGIEKANRVVLIKGLALRNTVLRKHAGRLLEKHLEVDIHKRLAEDLVHHTSMGKKAVSDVVVGV